MIRSSSLALLASVLWGAFPVPGAAQAQTASTRGLSEARPAVPATGRIEGVVTLSPKLTEARMRFRPYSDFGQGQFPSERERPVDPFDGVVIYVVSPTLTDEAVEHGDHERVGQADEFFDPKVLPVRRGTTVEFVNDDDIFHNVFSLSRASSFDLGRYPRGESRSVRFDEVGVVSVFCHIHSDMAATVLVLDNPYFAKPDAEGRFTISGLPPGDHTVVLWHERMRPLELDATVAPGEVVQLEVHLPFPAQSSGR